MKPAAAPPPGSAPVTFGQLSVQRINETYPLEHWSGTYLTHVIALPEGTAPDAVRAALHGIAARHESLRTRFVEVAGGRYQVVDPTADVEVRMVEQPGCGPDDVTRIVVAAAHRRFSWAQQCNWRAVLVTDDGRPTHLGIVLDHIVSDQWGLRRLAAELRASLGMTDPEGERWLTGSVTQPSELALLQRAPQWSARRDGAAAYWRRLLTTLPPDVFPVRPPVGVDDAGRVEAILHSPAARQALAGSAHRFGVSPQTVMLGLTALAVHRVTGKSPAVLTLQASNRHWPWHDLVTSMNQYTPVAIPIPEAGETFGAFVKRVHWAGINAYRHGSYDVDAIWELVTEHRGAPPDFDHFFNFMADDMLPQEPGPVTEPPGWIERNRPRRQIGPRFDVKVRGGPDLCLVVRADPGLVNEQALEDLLRWFEGALLRTASGEAIGVEVMHGQPTH